ncbi:AMP-binding protein [Uliginosibacterium sp. H3]|uniref:AMP-binding protein n=1 Tax=Uliginosibacterium silvisoli TaxID=3114758 RepID=A0ABU6K0X0_9RHOO|nr:AMP-binding protein [Uliginosibacterium sp. H3]
MGGVDQGVGKAAAAERLPLSAAQLGIWLGQQLDPASPSYWTAEAIVLDGELDVAAFEAALSGAIDECEALHVRFRADDAASDEVVWQVPVREAWSLRHIDLSARGDLARCELAAQRWLYDDLQRTADLAHGALFATALLRLAPQRHLWTLRVHHVALDGYGYALLQRRVAALYARATGVQIDDQFSKPRATLAAVIEEAREYQQHASAADRAFWTARLAGAAAPVSLAPPATLARGVRKARGDLAREGDTGAQVLERWQAAAKNCGVDWAAWLIATAAAWLAQHTGARDITLGLPVMGRLGSVGLTVPCMAMNIVPLRIQVDPAQGIAALAKSVAAEMRAIRPHQRYRYEWLRHDLGRANGGQRLFGPVINLMPFDRPLEFGALAARALPVSAGPVEDLSITVAPHATGMRFDFEANPHAYDADTLSAHRASLVHTIDTLLAAPIDAPLVEVLSDWLASTLPALSIIEGEPINEVVSVLDALRAHATATPHAIAVEQDGKALSYAELLVEVKRLAAVLAGQGVTREDRVAILLPRSPQTIVALLAVLWAGAGYVPLDPDSPDARIAMVLADARPRLVLSVRGYAERVGGDLTLLCLDELANDPSEPAQNSPLPHAGEGQGERGREIAPEPSAALDGGSPLPQPLSHKCERGAQSGSATPTTPVIPAKAGIQLPSVELDPGLRRDDEPGGAALWMEEPVPVADNALAYIIYTSGSTGRPNGVMIGRDALAHFVAGARMRYAMTPADRVLQFAPLHFDASVEEIFLSLTIGATLVLRNDAMLESLPRFLAACAAKRISVLDLPTAFWHELAYCVGDESGAHALPPSIRLVIIGGEAALAERIARWRKVASPHVVLLNTYGPTETTVICTTAVLSGPDALTWSGESVPIGAPLPGMTAVVVDDALRPVAPGEAGELCMIGGALARGYFERQQVTDARFIQLASLTHAPRAYRTGDRVREAEDGALVYLGRLDDEFKISGYRIDPAEIETALLDYRGVREAAVVGQVLPGGSKRLAAFIVCDGEPDSSALQQHLAQRLPAPAIPSAYVPLNRLPRNANNKIDRAALRTLGLDDAVAKTGAASESANTATLSPLQRTVIKVWSEVLGTQQIGADSDFFALGGKSLQAIQVANRLGVALLREVAVSSLFRHPSVAALAAALDVPEGHTPPDQASDPFAPLLRIQSGDASLPALFCVHPAEGLSWCYMGLAAQLRNTPIYGLQSRGMTGESPAHIDEVVTDYIALVRSVQPHGPYRFMGWSSGGGITHAMAARMQADGEQVELLAMMDAYPSDIWAGKPEPTERDALIVLLDVIGYAGKGHLGDDGQPLSLDAMRARLQRPGTVFADRDAASLARLTGQAIDSMKLYRGLRHPVFEGDVLFFYAAQRPAEAPDWLGWRPYVKGELQRVDIDSTHNGMSQRAPLAHIGRELAKRLES